MSIRIVLYAEGPAEDAAAEGLPPTPCEVLDERSLGAAHVLVRRVIEQDSSIPAKAVLFVGPLRGRGGRVVRGSDLLRRSNVRQLLSWPAADRRPDLAVLLVDDDGQKRRGDILSWLRDPTPLTLEAIVAVPVQEFEAWLIADEGAVPGTTSLAEDPESLPPGQAKQLLRNRLATARVEDALTKRIDIARNVDLARLARLRAFAQFSDDLRGALKRRSS